MKPHHPEIDAVERRVLLCTPTGRDAELIERVLREARVACHVCSSAEDLIREIDHGAGALLVAEEALTEERQLALAARLSAQPAWSDLSLILLSLKDCDNPAVGAALRALGNLTLLERPIRAWVLASVVKAALRARSRQYQMRHQLLELERLVEALRAAEGTLREADRRKDEFLAVLAHELRNPLAPIRNAVSLLRMSGSDDRLVAMARDVIERQGGQLTRLVDDLLDLSRITRGTVSLQRERVSLLEALQAAIETSQPALRAARVEFESELPSSDVSLYADQVRITQAISNLLNNAAKFTPAGGTVCLRAEAHPLEVAIHVRDSGVGIAPDVLPRIFELFVQEERVAGRSRTGLGIGLTLVKQFVEMHGGTVEVRSAGPGTGSEFVMRLPRLVEERRDAGGARETDSERDDSPPGRSVLIVDDNHDNAATLRELVQSWGCTVRVASDGAEALALLEEAFPEIVLLDLGMPGMDGFEVARRIRGRADGEECLLVAMTGWGDARYRERSRSAGFDEFLVKPVNFERLRMLVGMPRFIRRTGRDAAFPL